MSTAARKARKRAGEQFVRVPKVGTPVEERVENQPRSILRPGTLVQKRFGLPSKAAARLKSWGIAPKAEVDE